MSLPIQQSLFDDDFLIRTLGEIAYRPETAISELVANAWDAGASCVQIAIPDEIGGTISVNDDGIGLNQDLFLTRWMKLGYSLQWFTGCRRSLIRPSRPQSRSVFCDTPRNSAACLMVINSLSFVTRASPIKNLGIVMQPTRPTNPYQR